MTGDLAHDFNNLLTVVIGNLAALQDPRPDDPAVDEFVEPALQSARRGVQLIKRLLTFSRQQPLEPQVVDIGQLIASLAKSWSAARCPSRFQVSTDLSAASACPGRPWPAGKAPRSTFALNARRHAPGRPPAASRPARSSWRPAPAPSMAAASMC